MASQKQKSTSEVGRSQRIEVSWNEASNLDYAHSVNHAHDWKFAFIQSWSNQVQLRRRTTNHANRGHQNLMSQEKMFHRIARATGVYLSQNSWFPQKLQIHIVQRKHRQLDC